LESKVRELETEVFELRRGVWRDSRRSLQPGLDESTASFTEVELSPANPTAARGPAMIQGGRSHPQKGSSITDVINSGINAFTGATPSHHPRKQSLGLLDDDFDFDEEGFRRAQEEEAAARIERVKEIKRGLKKWEGWRVDIADLRAGMGGVFEV